MIRFRQSSPALTAMILISLARLAQAFEPATGVVQSREAFGPLQFTHLCVRPCDCGKPLCGLPYCAPAFTCLDDYCPKPLPRISLCWPNSRCDDYCSKPLPCWPRDPCACAPGKATSVVKGRATRHQNTPNTAADATATR